MVGVYLTDRESRVRHLVEALAASRAHRVEQRWIALGRARPDPAVAPVTVQAVQEPRPRFTLVNELLAGVSLDRYAYVLVCDDDFRLPEAFLDRYLALVGRHDLALAQPARTHGGHVEHAITEQMEGLDARLTRFVETGPLFSMRRDAARLLLPFDEAAPGGRGCELVWPVALESAGLRMGIVDATPLSCDLRPVAQRDLAAEQRLVKAFLDERSHVSRAEAFTVLEAYA